MADNYSIEDLYDEEEDIHVETGNVTSDVIQLGKKKGTGPSDPMYNNITNDEEEEEEEEEHEEDENEDGHEEDEEHEDEDPDVIRDLLRARGIKDPDKIQYLNDDDEIEFRKFNELPYEDQVNILKGEPDYSEDEVGVINFLRENDVTFDDAIKYYQRKAVEEYIANNEQAVTKYSVDDLTDDELMMADIRMKYPDLAPEEIAEQMEIETANEGLFKKKVNRLREEYKAAEESAALEAQEQDAALAEQAYEDFKGKIIESANKLDNILGLDLEAQDKEDVADFILARDVNGQTKLSKALVDPENIFKIAWFLSKGPEAFDMLQNYYEGVIKQTRRQVTQSGNKPTVKKPERQGLIVSQNKKSDKDKRKPLSLHDMDY